MRAQEGKSGCPEGLGRHRQWHVHVRGLEFACGLWAFPAPSVTLPAVDLDSVAASLLGSRWQVVACTFYLSDGAY